MKLAKYSQYKDKVYTTVATGEGSNTSSSPTSSDRNLWGNDDTGNDMNGSMRIQGNIYIMGETTTEDEEGNEIPTSRSGVASSRAGDDPFPPSAEDGEGNMFLDGKVYSDGVETKNDIVAGRHLYINDPHPAHSGEKKCVGELINALDGRITTNTNNITNLTTRVTTAEGNLTNLTSRMDDAEDGIADNADEIKKMKASNLTEDDVLALIRANQPSMLGSINQPVILWAGRLAHNTFNAAGSWDDWPFAKLPHFTFASNSHTNGLMTIDLDVSEGYKLNVVAVHATQYQSGDTTSSLDNPYIKGRSDGAHWFECRTDDYLNTKKVYIREFHQGNGDNDTWYSDNWNGDGGGIQAINLTLIGYITPPST